MLGRHADEGALVLEHPALKATAQDVLDLSHRVLAFLLVVGHLHQDVLLRDLPEKRQKKKNRRNKKTNKIKIRKLIRGRRRENTLHDLSQELNLIHLFIFKKKKTKKREKKNDKLRVRKKKRFDISVQQTPRTYTIKFDPYFRNSFEPKKGERRQRKEKNKQTNKQTKPNESNKNACNARR